MAPKKLRPYIFSLLFAVFLIGLEFLLREVDFRYEPDAEFSFPRPADFAQVRYHPDLFWTLNPDDPGVNDRGFLGEEVVVEKPVGVYRILFIGDSIMEAGYPREVGACLHDGGEANIEAITLAVKGYSSYQGKKVAEQFGQPLNPDLVVVQFGWNDHWLAFGEPDAEKSFSSPPAWRLAIHHVYDRVRVLQVLGWVWGVGLGQGNVVTDQLRVPVEAYRSNLIEISTLFAQDEVPVIFVTAPTSHEQLGVPEELIQRRFAAEPNSVRDLHQVYNQITREVAGENLVDVAREFAAMGAEDIRPYFQQDGVHPTRAGTQKIAELVCEKVIQLLR
ncbi:MAG: SGNH/GDSL hydrolase family protein [Anaerolineales bacterium]